MSFFVIFFSPSSSCWKILKELYKYCKKRIWNLVWRLNLGDWEEFIYIYTCVAFLQWATKFKEGESCNTERWPTSPVGKRDRERKKECKEPICLVFKGPVRILCEKVHLCTNVLCDACTCRFVDSFQERNSSSHFYTYEFQFSKFKWILPLELNTHVQEEDYPMKRRIHLKRVWYHFLIDTKNNICFYSKPRIISVRYFRKSIF